MHAGFVGIGLDAACPGEFSLLLPLIKCWQLPKVDGGAGILYIVKNYSGDVMNFEITRTRPHGGHPGADIWR